MDIIYKKEADIDEENNFTIDLTADNNIDRKFFGHKENI